MINTWQRIRWIWQPAVPGIPDGAIKVGSCSCGARGGRLLVQILGADHSLTLRTGADTNRIPHPWVRSAQVRPRAQSPKRVSKKRRSPTIKQQNPQVSNLKVSPSDRHLQALWVVRRRAKEQVRFVPFVAQATFVSLPVCQLQKRLWRPQRPHIDGDSHNHCREGKITKHPIHICATSWNVGGYALAELNRAVTCNVSTPLRTG